jgi:hypothetical protein
MLKFLTLKKVLIPLAAGVVVAALGVSHYQAYRMGQDNVNLALMEDLEKSRSEQARLTDALEEAQQNRRIVYRDRTRIVYREPDSSGCDLVRAPDRVLESLGYTDRPEADGASGATGAAGPDQP